MLSCTTQGINHCPYCPWRYLKIVRPLETHTLQTPRAARIISTITWTILGGLSLVYTVISLMSSRSSVLPHSIGCESLHSNRVSQLYKAVHTASAATFFFVLVSLVGLYHGTRRRLEQAQRARQAQRSCQKLAKSKRNMLILVSVFCVCFVPYHLVRLPYAFLKDKLTCFAWAHAFFTLKEATVLLSVCNACLDPLIYFIFCKAFRAQFGLKKKQKQGSPSNATEVRRISLGGVSLAPLNGVINRAIQPNIWASLHLSWDVLVKNSCCVCSELRLKANLKTHPEVIAYLIRTKAHLCVNISALNTTWSSTIPCIPQSALGELYVQRG